MMFTGIIQAIGQVRAVEPREGDCRLQVHLGQLSPERLAPGASLAVNGVCLTIAERVGAMVSLDVSRETLIVTTLGNIEPGAHVNLEPALTLNDPLGGHLVSGHVDGMGEVMTMQPDARSTRIWIRIPGSLVRFVAQKGSVCVDGVSLTVNEITGEEFGINVVPHTIERTIMGRYAIGTSVNIEVDLIARYLDRLVQIEN
jgi:riboflavin synthase